MMAEAWRISGKKQKVILNIHVTWKAVVMNQSLMNPKEAPLSSCVQSFSSMALNSSLLNFTTTQQNLTVLCYYLKQVQSANCYLHHQYIKIFPLPSFFYSLLSNLSLHPLPSQIQLPNPALIGVVGMVTLFSTTHFHDSSHWTINNA